MSNYNHTPKDKQTLKQANNTQSDSKLIRLKTNLSFVSLIDWTAIILFVGLCVSHCVPAYAETLGDTKETLGDGIGYAMMTLDNVTGDKKIEFSEPREGVGKFSDTLGNRVGNASKVFEHYKKSKNNVTQNETLVSVKAIANQAIAGNETLMKQLNETVSFKNHLTNDKVGGYYKALSKNNSDTPNRKPMAFFMPKDCLTSQIKQYNSINHITPLQGKTVISIANTLLNLYDGLTLQNTIASWRICRAVTIVTESKTHHPIINSVVLTQKTIGGQI